MEELKEYIYAPPSEIIKLNDEYIEQIIGELQNRNKNAVEYIETWNCLECDKGTMREICFGSDKEDLLEILKGDGTNGK